MEFRLTVERRLARQRRRQPLQNIALLPDAFHTIHEHVRSDETPRARIDIDHCQVDCRAACAGVKRSGDALHARTGAEILKGQHNIKESIE